MEERVEEGSGTESDLWAFKAPDKVNTRPATKNLQQCVTSKYATNWREIGIQLNLSDGDLSIIEEDNPRSVKKRCNAMLSKWLAVDSSASWKKLFAAIDACTGQCAVQGPVQVASDHFKHCYVQTRFITTQEEWPPGQPKHFSSLALIHFKNGYTEKEVIAILEEVCNCTVDDIMDMFPTCSQNTSSEQSQEQVKTSKDVKEIFTPGKDGQEPRSILIEGSPGIGKTALSKEIAFQWAKGLLLMDRILLFLIFLRDPLVRKIASLKDLVKYYYQFDESSENVASSCAECLLHSEGKNVTFIFDGYDEYPETLRLNGFIPDILQRKVLPCCNLVVTSRPHASAYLRTNCDRFIEILGFTKEDQRNYMIRSLQEDQNVDELIEYLGYYPTISSLCYIPFNMTVLLWLYEQEIALPSSSTELYNCFICHTIRYHLAKYQIHLPDSFIDLNSLEKPYRQVIIQLSVLSYEALNENKLTFTLEEVKSACPQVDEIPEALTIRGFGLLQAVRHFGSKMNITLNFVHFTVQEFLAAYHISCLPHYPQFSVIKEKFMSDFHANTFTMYVGMTKGENPAFKQYLGGNHKWIVYMYGVFGRFTPFIIFEPCFGRYESPLNTCFWLRLFKCFCEAGDTVSCHEIIDAVSYLFGGNVIVSGTLLPSDVECLCLFLCCKQEWKGLYFYQSFDDVRFQILHQLLTNETAPPCIHTIYIGSTSDLSSQYGMLTQSSSRLITEIAKSCKTEVLEVFGPLILLKDVVSLKNQLTKLVFYVEKSQIAAAVLVCLNDDKILKVLDYYEMCSSRDPTEAFMEALEFNNVKECSLAYLTWMKLYRRIKLGMLNGLAHIFLDKFRKC